MRARSYKNIIEFWQTSNVADGYGGFTVNETLITKSWCNIKTANNSNSVSRLTDLGINDPTNSIIIKTRFRNDINYNAINQFIKYRGQKYIIQNAPTNIDFMDVDIEIIATLESTDTVSEIAAI